MNAFILLASGRRFLVLSGLAIALFFSPSVHAQQWSGTNGPWGGQIRCMVTSGTTVYAGTIGHGLFSSSDAGTTWAPVAINGSTYDTTVFALAASGSTILAGTSGGTDILSTDGGQHWSIGTVSQGGLDIVAVTVSGSTLLASASGDGVYSSSDNGVTWLPSNSGIRSSSITALTVSGSKVFAAVVGHQDTSLRVSADNGKTWILVPTPGMSTLVNVLASTGSVLVAGADDGVYFSTDGGVTWLKHNTGLKDSAVYSVTGIGTTVYLGTVDYTNTSGGVFSYSVLSGVSGSWSSITTDIIGGDKVWGLAASGSTIVAGTDNGIYSGSTTSTTWTASNTGLSAMKITALRSSGNTMLAGTDDFDAFWSTDQGAHWTHSWKGLVDISSDTHLPIYDVAINGSTLFAATDLGISTSTDNGNQWTLLQNSLTDSSVHALYAGGTGTFLIAGIYSGIFTSADNGANFAYGSTGFTAHNVSVFTANASNVYAGSSDGGVFTSAISPVLSWTNLNAGLTVSTPVSALATGGSNVFAGTNGSGVFVSNANLAWSHISGTIPATLFVSGLATSNDTLFIATPNAGAYYATQGAVGWKGGTFGASNLTLENLILQGSLLFAGTSDYGVQQSPTTVIPQQGVEQSAAATFSFTGAVPNPVSSRTSIGFSLDKPGAVELSISDVSGREITLLSGETLGEGSHEFTWDASGVPAGVYLCRLMSNGASVTRNIIVTK